MKSVFESLVCSNIFQAPLTSNKASTAASTSFTVDSPLASKPSMAFVEASSPLTSVPSTSKFFTSSSNTSEICRDLDRHIAAADKIIDKLRPDLLSDDNDFGFELDDPNEIINDIPDEVMEAVHNGELDIDDIFTPDLGLAPNAQYLLGSKKLKTRFFDIMLS